MLVNFYYNGYDFLIRLRSLKINNPVQIKSMSFKYFMHIWKNMPKIKITLLDRDLIAVYKATTFVWFTSFCESLTMSQVLPIHTWEYEIRQVEKWIELNILELHKVKIHFVQKHVIDWLFWAMSANQFYMCSAQYIERSALLCT